MQPYRKFIVAAVGALVVFLHTQGVDVADDITQTAIAIITAALVYLVPNG